jgi:hypothetical protein
MLVFCDVMYVCGFNSFYMDTIAYLALLLSLVLYARMAYKCGDLRWNYLGSVAFAALFLTSKMQHLPAGLVLLAFLVWKGPKPWRTVAVGVAVVAAGVALYSRAVLSHTMKATHPFNLIFSGILPASKDVSQDLRELGLDDSFRAYVGMHAYSPGNPVENEEFAKAFERRVGLARVAWFYVRHPAVPIRLIKSALVLASIQRVDTLGTFDRSEGLPPGSMSQAFAVWSDLKYALFARKPWPYMTYFVLLSLLVAALAMKGCFPAPLSMVLLALAWTEFLVACLADAAEVGRHMFLFNAFPDLFFILAVSAVRVRVR